MDGAAEIQLGADDNSVKVNDANELDHLIADAGPFEEQDEKPPSVFQIDRPETKFNRYPSNQLDEVNPFAFIKGKDDEDDASIGSEDFGTKLLPQADGHGDFENVPEVRRNLRPKPVIWFQFIMSDNFPIHACNISRNKIEMFFLLDWKLSNTFIQLHF